MPRTSPRSRPDGWTAARQDAFVALLADGVGVGAAAARVGMTASTAYRLRAKPHGADFARRWAAAVAGHDRRRAAARSPTWAEKLAARPCRTRRDIERTDMALIRLLIRFDRYRQPAAGVAEARKNRSDR